MPGALVLFSGGQDSTTALAWALSHHERVETIGFDYGQRHAVELGQRGIIREKLPGVLGHREGRLGDDHVLALPSIPALGGTAMTEDVAIEMAANGLPNTFVPGRNLLFFTYAAALAYRRGIDTLVGGMCETDYSGYPDCRDATLQTLAQAISLGLDVDMIVETPLMWIDKAGTWKLAHELGGDALVELVIADTHSCYVGVRDRVHAWGAGCGTCPACELRAKGWDEWQITRTPVQAR